MKITIRKAIKTIRHKLIYILALLYTDQFLYLDNQVDDMSITAEKGYFLIKNTR